jgi:prepilin-type N-terminal cleavage/methylation domain-containing protein
MSFLRARIQNERGFTLIELLAVTAIIGILAAISLPAFLGEQNKGHDADAKSNVRNVVAAVESCFTEKGDYASCDTYDEFAATDTKPGAELTDATTKKKGAVSVTGDADAYTVTAYSKSNTEFSVTKAADGSSTRTCSDPGEGGCTSGTGVW